MIFHMIVMIMAVEQKLFPCDIANLYVLIHL